MYNDIGDWMLVLFFLLLCFKPCLMLNKMPVSVMFDHIRTQQWYVLQQPRTNTKDLDYPFLYIFCMLIPIHAYLMKHCCMIEMLGSLSRSWHAIQQRLVVLFPSYTSRQTLELTYCQRWGIWNDWLCVVGIPETIEMLACHRHTKSHSCRHSVFSHFFFHSFWAWTTKKGQLTVNYHELYLKDYFHNYYNY